VANLIQRLRALWLSVTAPRPTEPEYPEVIVHDPAAQDPHDLDDPFFDSGVQSRISRVIADNASTKHVR
jgi:hypothetical protein